jgi:SAM-dependent methyltransferase
MDVAGEGLALYPRSCPLCGSDDDSNLYAQEHLDPAKLGPLAFASRKLPEYMHYRLIECPVCDVVYANPAPSDDLLSSAYEEAGYDSPEEAAFAARTYGQLLGGIIEQLPSKRRGLDIGAGDGAFLATMLDAGFSEVTGVEPSTAPIRAASDRVRPFIRQGMFSAKDFTPGYFDLITCFQALEHVTDPARLSQEVHSLLAPGGAAMFVCHNRRALSARALGRRSPIFDVEHLQLFSPRSLRYLLEHTGYVKVEVKPIFNRYPLRYWAKLFPLPAAAKKPLLRVLGSTKLGTVPFSLPAGNLVAVGYRG